MTYLLININIIARAYTRVRIITYQQSHFYQIVDIIFWYIKENEKSGEKREIEIGERDDM